MKFNIIISLAVFTIFVLISSLLGIQYALAQQDILTDTDALMYYANPSQHVNKNVNFTGKILNLLPPSIGTLGLQMYQAGDPNRNTIVVYATPMQLSQDECVRVIGVTQPVTEYQNMFGARLSAAAINAESIKKIECSESIEPAIKTVNVNQTQQTGGIKVTLHKVEFSDKNTRTYLTVENTGTSEDITFDDYNSRAIQGKSQFITTNSYDVDYPEIVSTIPASIEENGVVLFEPLDPTQGKAQFRFEARDSGYNTIKFIFDVIVSPKEYYENLLTETNDIDTLYNISSSLYDSGNYTEAIRFYDKIISINPNDTYALNNKGLALSDLGNKTEAIRFYDKVLEIDPNDTYALNNKGLALDLSGNKTEAIRFYDKALEVDPNSTTTLVNKGRALSDLGNKTEAIRFYDKALSIEPNYTYALNFKGRALSDLGNYTGAINFYDKVLRIDPSDFFAPSFKDIALSNLGNHTKAIK